MMNDPKLSDIISIVYQAGGLISGVRGNEDANLDIKEKEGTANFVTKYDSMVQRFLEERLPAAVPGCSFMAEEDGQSEVSDHSGWQFVIDPIDGTTNFVVGFMLSAICVGLAKDGVPVMGVVYNPFRDEMFYAERGKGAFLNGKPIHVREGGLSAGVIIMGGAPYNPERRDFTYDCYKAVVGRVMDLHVLGTAALGMCYTACGRAIAYASPGLAPWDYTAASVITEEAGGICTDYFGGPLVLKKGCSCLCGGAQSHKEYLELVASVIEKHNWKGYVK